MREVGTGTYQVLMLTVIFFLPGGEIFYVQTIIRREAPNIFFLDSSHTLHTHPQWKLSVLGEERRTFRGTRLHYTTVAAFMRQTTRRAPEGKPHDGQALYLSQEQAGQEEGK